MALGFDEPIRGVNLGNWLVLERWMTPGLFRASGEADEIWMHRTMPSDALDRLLRRHRETYVTLDDFRAIAAHGCNLVRIPVPYFIFGDVPGHPGCVGFLDRAFDWANATGLKVLIDLHTVPGSQNGYDNGGLTGVCRWRRSPKAVGFAVDVLTRLAARYRDDPALFGIEVLNEPVSWLVYRTAASTGAARDAAEARGSGHVPMRFLKAFYRESYRRLRGVLRPEAVIMFHDGFRLGAWGDWFVREGMRNVVLDTHIYRGRVRRVLPGAYDAGVPRVSPMERAADPSCGAAYAGGRRGVEPGECDGEARGRPRRTVRNGNRPRTGSTATSPRCSGGRGTPAPDTSSGATSCAGCATVPARVRGASRGPCPMRGATAGYPG